MRDFPAFATENGIASLTLRDIPYWGDAYIKIHSVSDESAFIEECVSFCRAVGAKRIYGNGHVSLQKYPFYTSVLKMVTSRDSIPESVCSVFPVTDETREQWRSVYNEKMQMVPNASYLSLAGCREMQRRGEAYFIHRNGVLVGIGASDGCRIKVVASLQRGMGREIVKALSETMTADMIELEVSSENQKAVTLYESLGFVKSGEISRWYKIFEDVK